MVNMDGEYYFKIYRYSLVFKLQSPVDFLARGEKYPLRLSFDTEWR